MLCSCLSHQKAWVTDIKCNYDILYSVGPDKECFVRTPEPVSAFGGRGWGPGRGWACDCLEYLPGHPLHIFAYRKESYWKQQRPGILCRVNWVILFICLLDSNTLDMLQSHWQLISSFVCCPHSQPMASWDTDYKDQNYYCYSERGGAPMEP